MLLLFRLHSKQFELQFLVVGPLPFSVFHYPSVNCQDVSDASSSAQRRPLRSHREQLCCIGINVELL